MSDKPSATDESPLTPLGEALVIAHFWVNHSSPNPEARKVAQALVDLHATLAVSESAGKTDDGRCEICKQEIDEFNAGVEAHRAGVAYHDLPSMPMDQNGVGWAWAAWNGKQFAPNAAALNIGGEPVREEVLRFAVLMERELKENDHKDHWRDCGISYLLKRLREEVVELETLLLATSAPQPADIASETADVANFAMMIADNAKALPRGSLVSARGEMVSVPLSELEELSIMAAVSTVDPTIEELESILDGIGNKVERLIPSASDRGAEDR